MKSHLKDTISLLNQALSDNEWNTSELLREFEAGWLSIVEPATTPFLCFSESGKAERLCVLKPRKKNNTKLGSYFLGYEEECIPNNIFRQLISL
ncbi:MAG: hypothetical protein PW844_22960 [Pantoea sp.]|uniref:hypothetical protein n=1 Tax=Pantoea sp. TaxID=69393 RepID=UPI00239FA820|nr:hypothetical protein [Pantoea sp.]MDE1189290.1 hypothetical protein [Pantoea sp.]